MEKYVFSIMDSLLSLHFGTVVGKFSNGTGLAEGLFGETDFPAMPDEEVRKMGPLFFRDDLHQIEFDLDRIVILRQTDSLAYPVNMGIDRNTGYSKGIS